MDEGNFVSDEQPVPSSSQSSQVETVQVDYSSQIQVLIDQQQVSIGISAMLMGILLVASMIIVFSRFF